MRQAILVVLCALEACLLLAALKWLLVDPLLWRLRRPRACWRCAQRAERWCFECGEGCCPTDWCPASKWLASSVDNTAGRIGMCPRCHNRVFGFGCFR